MNNTKIVSDFFSDRYANHSAIQGNFIVLWMYRFSYPLAVIFTKLKLTPNQITTLSLIFSIVACVSLVFLESNMVFAALWGISVILDLCDGTVARMNNNKSTSAFRYDHMSDLFKIYILTLSISLHFMDTTVWVMAVSASCLYLYNMVLTHDILKYKSKPNEKINSDKDLNNRRLRHRYSFVAWLVKFRLVISFYKAFHSILLTVSAHTYLLFCLMPYNVTFTLSMLSYLALISILHAAVNIKTLNSYSR